MNAPLRQSERLGRLTTELGPDALSLLALIAAAYGGAAVATGSGQ